MDGEKQNISYRTVSTVSSVVFMFYIQVMVIAQIEISVVAITVTAIYSFDHQYTNY